MKRNRTTKDRRSRERMHRQEHERDNILRPELFSMARHGNLLVTKERRTGEERPLIGKYLELADIAFNNPGEAETSLQVAPRNKEKDDDAA